MEEKIRKWIYGHCIEEIGTPGRPYITRYRLNLDVKVVATELRIYADDAGKFQISPENQYHQPCWWFELAPWGKICASA